MLCKQIPGFKTNHPGEGRCYLHGGMVNHELAPIEGVRAAVDRTPRALTGLAARAREIRESDDLLNLDNEIAVVKVIFSDQLRGYEAASKLWEAYMQRIESGAYDEGEEPVAPNTPEIDLKTLDTLSRLVKITLDARFARRHSIPIAELENVVNQIAMVFNRVCETYGMSNEARVAFKEGLELIQLSRLTDFQLDRAGGMKKSHVVDGDGSYSVHAASSAGGGA